MQPHHQHHIKINYGEVKPRQLRENEAALKAPWDASTPIVTLYKRIEDCQTIGIQQY